VTAGSRLRLLSLSSTAETDWQIRNPSRLLCGKLDCRYQCIVAKKKLFGEKGHLSELPGSPCDLIPDRGTGIQATVLKVEGLIIL
jgi:hypothetical protein